MGMKAGIRGFAQGRHVQSLQMCSHRAYQWHNVALILSLILSHSGGLFATSVLPIKHLWSNNNGLDLEGSGIFYFQIRNRATQDFSKDIVPFYLTLSQQRKC